METVPSKEVFSAPPPEPVGTQLMNLDPKTYVTQVFASFTQRLAAAKAEAAKIAVVDVSTKAGMALAVKHRAVFRAIRIEAESERETRKAPILAIGRLLDSRNKEIETEVLAEEKRFDNAIQEDKRIKQEAEAAKIRAEQERLAAEELARKAAEEQKLAEERARLAAERAELERQQAEQREAAAKALREQEELAKQARDRIEADERAARMRREEEDRAARAARDEADRKAKEQQERNQAAISEVQGIQQQVIIAQVGRLGVRAGGTIACIEATLAETEAWEIDAERFGFFTTAAAKAKEQAVEQIRALLAAAVARAAEEAKLKEDRERLDAQRRAAEEEQHRARVAQELKEAAERRAEEDRQRFERDRVAAEQRAIEDRKRKEQDAEEARQREAQRQKQKSLDAHDMLVAWVEQYGDLEEYAELTSDIKEFLADVPNQVPA